MTATINAVELVRHVRDHHAALLQDKSPAEIQAFFRREAAAANAEAERVLRDRTVDLERRHDQEER